MQRHGLALTLDAAGLPLRLHWSLTVDPATGVLLRRTRLEHTGVAPVDLRGALSVSTQVVGRLEPCGRSPGHGPARGRCVRSGPTIRRSCWRAGRQDRFEYQPWLPPTVDDATVIVQLAASGNWHRHVRHRDDGLFISGGLPEVGFQTELRAGGGARTCPR